MGVYGLLRFVRNNEYFEQIEDSREVIKEYKKYVVYHYFVRRSSTIILYHHYLYSIENIKKRLQ